MESHPDNGDGPVAGFQFFYIIPVMEDHGPELGTAWILGQDLFHILYG